MTDYGLHAFAIEGNSSSSKTLSYDQLLMVYLRKWSGLSAFATANKMNTEVRNVIQAVREFNILRSLSKQLNSKSYCIGRKIKKVHLEWISEWLIEMQNKNFTLSKLRLELLKEFPKIGSVGISTLSILLRKQFKMSYKKIGILNPKQERVEIKGEIVNWANILKWFENTNHHIVYIDEFSVNRKTESKYGWAKSGKKGWKVQSTLNFKMSFIVGFSWRRLEGLLGYSESNTSQRFILFLKGILK